VSGVIPFHEFCDKVLHLTLTTGQRVVAKVAFGNYSVSDLEGEERELGLKMFGGATEVPPEAKKFVCLRLGRGSGKTTLCSAYAVYTAVAQPVKVGPGDSPYVMTIAPDKETAKLSISMAREMMRSNPALERLVVAEEKQAITLRRPNGLQVKIEAFAASAKGTNTRGRTILAFLLDEAEFFTSSQEGDGRAYAVNDTDIFRALKPRLVKGGKGMLVSTPWPVPTLMGAMFDRNWGKPTDAVAIKAPTMWVRGDDPDVREIVEAEFKTDPENARREFDCEIDAVGGEGFFDYTALQTSFNSGQFPGQRTDKHPCIAAADFGFKHDSSTLCIVEYDGKKYNLLHVIEMIPKPGKPLVPSEVVKSFASAAKLFGCSSIISDGHYREAIREHLLEHHLSLVDAPEGITGKEEVFSRVRAVLHEGRVGMPKHRLTERLVAQAKLVTSKPSPGGRLTIKTPRKTGFGHGDIVSSWALAVWRLAYGRVVEDKPKWDVDSPEWHAEFMRKQKEWDLRRNREALRASEKAVRSNMSDRRHRSLFRPILGSN
jgi:hypothetical protein